MGNWSRFEKYSDSTWWLLDADDSVTNSGHERPEARISDQPSKQAGNVVADGLFADAEVYESCATRRRNQDTWVLKGAPGIPTRLAR